MENNYGVIPRTIDTIYDKYQNEAIKKSKIYLSMFQIYNEKVYDLLGDQDLGKVLEIK